MIIFKRQPQNCFNSPDRLFYTQSADFTKPIWFVMLRCSIYKVQSRRRSSRRLVYLTTTVFVCQDLFSNFFKFFSSLIRFSSGRSLERLIIISAPSPFVNTFFLFSRLFSWIQKTDPYNSIYRSIYPYMCKILNDFLTSTLPFGTRGMRAS